jgi:hypothetical protein
MLVLQILGATAVLLLFGIYNRLGRLYSVAHSIDKRVGVQISDQDVWEKQKADDFAGKG